MEKNKKSYPVPKSGPATWKPVNIKEFNKNTKTISEMFNSDPKRSSKFCEDVKEEKK